MKYLYEAPNTVEAHMVQNMLEQVNITSRIDGDYLQGGVGELPAAGLIRIMVEESDYESAKEVIADWESSQIQAGMSKEFKRSNTLGAAVLGFVVGGISVATLYNTPITKNGIDYNRDGKLDEKRTYLDARIYKSEVDRNLDGEIDIVYKYNEKGLLDSSKSDEDFNGSFETEAYYSNGNPLRVESDTTGDTFKDYQIKFKHGVIHTITFSDFETRMPLKIQQYNGMKLISAKVDKDRDGSLETIYKYDGIEEPIK